MEELIVVTHPSPVRLEARPLETEGAEPDGNIVYLNRRTTGKA